MLTGGEPSLRADLPTLLAVAGPSGMRTDGLLLSRPSVLAALKKAGLSRVRIVIHSSRPDAHDWLSGAPGSLKRSLRGLQACVRIGLPVEVEIVLTRPTITHLPETVSLVARLGARGIALRRLSAQGGAEADFVALSPRLGLLRSPLEEAMAAADAAGVPAWIEGVPACMAPPNRPLGVPDVRETAACSDCPPSCPGYPADYAERFGLAELWRISPQPRQEILEVVVDAAAPTRDVRRLLVRTAMAQPETLRVIDVVAHPASADLLRELMRLSIPRVELWGEMSGLATLSMADRLRLRGFARIDAVVSSPEQARALEGLPITAVHLAETGDVLSGGDDAV